MSPPRSYEISRLRSVIIRQQCNECRALGQFRNYILLIGMKQNFINMQLCCSELKSYYLYIVEGTPVSYAFFTSHSISYIFISHCNINRWHVKFVYLNDFLWYFCLHSHNNLHLWSLELRNILFMPLERCFFVSNSCNVW